MRTITKLPDYEWNFTKIPKGELEAAWDHEVNREALKRLRRASKIDEWDPHLLEALVSQLGDSAYDEHYGFGPVKEIPWLRLRKKHKEALVYLHKYGRERFAPSSQPWVSDDRPLDKSLVCLSTTPYQMPPKDFASVMSRLNFTANDKKSLLCLFEIRRMENLDNRRQIVKEFSDWLDDNLGALKAVASKTRPSSRITGLMDLGIYRLYEFEKGAEEFKEVIAYLIRTNYPKRDKFDASKVGRARADALKEIQKAMRRKPLKVLKPHSKTFIFPSKNYQNLRSSIH